MPLVVAVPEPPGTVSQGNCDDKVQGKYSPVSRPLRGDEDRDDEEHKIGNGQHIDDVADDSPLRPFRLCRRRCIF